MNINYKNLAFGIIGIIVIASLPLDPIGLFLAGGVLGLVFPVLKVNNESNN